MSRLKRRMDREAYMREAEEARRKAEAEKMVSSVEDEDSIDAKIDAKLEEAMAKAVKEDTLPGIPKVEDEWTSVFQNEFNKKLAEQVSGNTELISALYKETGHLSEKVQTLSGRMDKLTKEVGGLKTRVEKLEKGGVGLVLTRGADRTPSKVKFMNEENYTGEALIPQAYDPTLGITWPIKDPRVAEFYDSNYKAAPCKLKKGVIERTLTLEEASKAGC
ncbi:hypothetical protein IKG33_01410 [Candidatus Saccharibacteria bacterium]|nr:hypothetical protein [Candidatus Saccharibacteria bacterium]